MNKRDATTKSLSGEISIGELRELIKAARQRGGMSRVNPALSLERACDIYEDAIAGRDATEVPLGLRQDLCGRTIPTKDSLIIRNILRDCT